MKEKIIILIIKIVDIILSPLTIVAGVYFKLVRLYGINGFVNRMPITKIILMKIGVFPISNHYYDPLINHENTNFDKERKINGLDFNINGQLELINSFSYENELKNFPKNKTNNNEFYYSNGSYPLLDSNYLYSIIRLKKPNTIIEIGSGNSTLMAINAINKNKDENINYNCKHTCIEPYEMPWLESTGVNIIRKKLENIDLNIFNELKENDILFIDSSHIIRPGGDVLTEYLQILPILNKGVLVHIHDILTPYEYPKQWLNDGVSFWNEQYLAEAFLINNNSYKIIGMMSYLYINNKDFLEKKFPLLKELKQGGSSLWLEKM